MFPLMVGTSVSSRENYFIVWSPQCQIDMRLILGMDSINHASGKRSRSQPLPPVMSAGVPDPFCKKKNKKGFFLVKEARSECQIWEKWEVSLPPSNFDFGFRWAPLSNIPDPFLLPSNNAPNMVMFLWQRTFVLSFDRISFLLYTHQDYIRQ